MQQTQWCISYGTGVTDPLTVLQLAVDSIGEAAS